MTPLVQLYCKKLKLEDLDGFLAAEPEHIGWQLNFGKLTGDDRSRAVEASVKISNRLRAVGVRSVFLIHPTTDLDAITAAVGAIQPDIFLASAERNRETLAALAAAGVSLMVPVGIPAAGPIADYDPRAEAHSLSSVASWMTTDTINPEDSTEAFGCSGKTSDWTVMSEVIRSAPIPVVAAGGLNPDNVAALWDLCKPRGMDAHTAVCTDGRPDREKSIAFARAVRALS